MLWGLQGGGKWRGVEIERYFSYTYGSTGTGTCVVHKHGLLHIHEYSRYDVTPSISLALCRVAVLVRTSSWIEKLPQNGVNRQLGKGKRNCNDLCSLYVCV